MTDELTEKKIPCSVLWGNIRYNGLAQLIHFKRDAMSFWFGQVDVASGSDRLFPPKESVQIDFEDGTFTHAQWMGDTTTEAGSDYNYRFKFFSTNGVTPLPTLRK